MKRYKVSTKDNEWSCIFYEETINRAKEYGASFFGRYKSEVIAEEVEEPLDGIKKEITEEKK